MPCFKKHEEHTCLTTYISAASFVVCIWPGLFCTVPRSADHQSAGALQGVVDVLRASPELLAAGADNVASMTVVAYQV